MSLFQNESKCKTFLMKMADFNLHENEPAGGTHFQMNGFALNLVLKQGHKGDSEMAYCITSFPGSLSFMPSIETLGTRLSITDGCNKCVIICSFFSDLPLK